MLIRLFVYSVSLEVEAWGKELAALFSFVVIVVASLLLFRLKIIVANIHGCVLATT